MSHRVFAIASGKGGVGKSVSTVNVGAALAEKGHRVIVVDADLGMANLAGLLDVDTDGPTLHDLLAGDADLDAVTYRVNGFDLIPSAADLQGFADAKPGAIKAVVDELRDAYDYVILDVGAGLSHDTLVPLAVADGVILVSTPDRNSVVDTGKTKDLTERLKGDVLGVLLTRAGHRHDLDVETVEEVLETRVLAVIPESEAIRDSVYAGEPVVTFAPDDPASAGYLGLVGMLARDAYGDAPFVPELEPATESDEGDAEPLEDDADVGEFVVDTEEPVEESDVADDGELEVDDGELEVDDDQELEAGDEVSVEAEDGVSPPEVGVPVDDEEGVSVDDEEEVSVGDERVSVDDDPGSVPDDEGVTVDAGEGVRFEEPADDSILDATEPGFEDDDALSDAASETDGEEGIAIEALDEDATDDKTARDDKAARDDEAAAGDSEPDEDAEGDDEDAEGDDEETDDDEEKKGFFSRLFG